jgi:ParB family transcriptional regulator, chromosome partitioning protein
MGPSEEGSQGVSGAEIAASLIDSQRSSVMKHTESRYIPLNALKKSPRNVRQVAHNKKHIEALAISIQAHGPIQDPVVETERDQEGKPTGFFLVTAGEGRRLAHLLRVKRKRIKADHPIRCTVDDEHNPQAISLAENVLHESMHPADQFVAFKALVDSGQPIEDVAAQYSVTPLVVQRRLKLANVAPEFIAMYRDGESKLTLEHLMALAATDDHERQRQVWKELPESRRSPDALRAALTQDEVPMSDPLARFVTLKVYERAGGVVRRDLFADADSLYLADRTLLERLAHEKLEKCAAKLRAEGLAWVEVAVRMDYAKRATYGHVRTVEREPTEQEAHALAEARDRLLVIEKEAASVQDEDKLSELDDAAAAVEDEIEQMEEALRVPDPEQQAIAGAIVTIGRDGKVEIDSDRLKPEDVNRFSRLGGHASSHQKSAAQRTHSASMTRRLTAHRTLALQARLAQQPEVAILALTHRLVLREFYAPGAAAMSALQVRTEAVPLRQDAPDLEQAKAQGVLQAQREKLRAQLPEQDELFRWLSVQPLDMRAELLAFCVAQAVNGVQSDDSRGAFDEIAAAAQLDMREWWTPTANGYFNSLPKAEILKAVKEATSPEVARPLELLKKASLVKSAEEKVAGTGWLPTLLRAHAA